MLDRWHVCHNCLKQQSLLSEPPVPASGFGATVLSQLVSASKSFRVHGAGQRVLSTAAGRLQDTKQRERRSSSQADVHASETSLVDELSEDSPFFCPAAGTA